MEQVARVAAMIRRRSFEMAVEHNGGYLIQACSSAEMDIGLVVTAENHLTRGGLGTAVAEVIAVPSRVRLDANKQTKRRFSTRTEV
jgi:hypothetical protein